MTKGQKRGGFTDTRVSYRITQTTQIKSSVTDTCHTG